MNKTPRSTLLLPIAALALSVAAAAQDTEDLIRRTIDVGPEGELSLSNISGDIHVTGTEGGSIVIEATKNYSGDARRGEDDVEVDISQVGDRVRVETRHRGRRGHRGVSVDYRVSVPRGTRVELASVSGDVTMESVDGESTVRSVSGSVSVSDAGNLAGAKSVSGEVEVRRARSRRDAEIATVSGDLRVSDIEAVELAVESVSGDVLIDGAFCERGSLSSVSGDLRYTGRIADGGRYELESHSGDVIMELTGDVGFGLEANTFSGDIESDFSMRVTSSDRRQRKLEGVYEDGSAFIEASTFSGDIEIRRR